jgi:hypothetical protein
MTDSTAFPAITKAAVILPILAAVYFSCRGFIALGLTPELVMILTLLFGALSWLLSQALVRFLEVRRAPLMAATVAVLGAAFLIIEASLTHIGLAWLFGQGKLDVPDLAVWAISFALSLTNVFAKWAFLAAAPAPALAQDLAKTARPERAPRADQPVDPATSRTVLKIAEAVNRAG